MEILAYPASCVKLPFMAAAMQWSRENGVPPSALHASVGPMITVSSNEATGEVVDAITGTVNLDDLTTATDFRFRSWADKRRYTERFLESRGLLGNQTIIHKTFPTNSGRSPRGAENVARMAFGGNRMQPRLSASLMLEIATGVLEPQAHAYMMQQLRHDRHTDDSVVGWGLPPGTEYFNKPGVAYDTCEDIAFARLPNGREFVIAAYSNSWDRGQPLPHDANRLGRFTEILLHQTGLTEGLTTVYAFADGFHAAPALPGDAPSPHLRLVPNTVTHSPDAVTTATISSTTRTLSTQVPVVIGRGTSETLATWTVPLPTSGHYELTAFHPAGRELATSAVLTISHANGSTTVALNQRNGERRPKVLGTYYFGAEPWKSPAAPPATSPTMAQITVAAPEGQSVALDAIRAQLWALNPPTPEKGK